MFYIRLLVMGVTGGIIGWITNLLAIKLLFKPVNPVNLLFGIKLQGILPARKEAIAKSLGEIIEKDLVSSHEIVENLISEKDIVKLKEGIVKNVVIILKDKLPVFLHSFTDNKIKKKIDDFMKKEGDKYIREMIYKTLDNSIENVSISNIVTEKILSLDLIGFEALVIEIVRKELRYIEVMGAVLGFIIGIIQGVIMLIFL